MHRTHRIRLHAAWKRAAGVSDDEVNPSFGDSVGAAVFGASTAVPVSLPDASLVDCPDPFVTYSRRFNRPSGLDEGTAVWLVTGLVTLATAIRLNGAPLAPSADSERIEIRGMLLPHNELRITVARDRFVAASQATAQLEIIDGSAAPASGGSTN